MFSAFLEKLARKQIPIQRENSKVLGVCAENLLNVNQVLRLALFFEFCRRLRGLPCWVRHDPLHASMGIDTNKVGTWGDSNTVEVDMSLRTYQDGGRGIGI